MVNDRQTKKDVSYQENQRVNKQVVILWGRDIDTTEEAADPDSQQPNNNAWENTSPRIIVSKGQIESRRTAQAMWFQCLT